MKQNFKWGTISDISKKLGIKRHQLWNKFKRDENFPKPVMKIGERQTPVFKVEDVVRFLNGNKEKS